MGSGVLAAWREVRAIVLTLLGGTLVALWAKKTGLALLSATLLGWVFYFFRDPERAPALPATDSILAPADGRITAIEQVDEPDFMRGPAWRLTIFLSLFDVHVQRSPCAGVVQLVQYQPGDFVPAFLEEAQRNESNLICLQTASGRLALKQIAGILARRIVCWVEPGDELNSGQRLGLIKFGSRVDLFLPQTVELLAGVGQQVYGGQTIVARWPE